MTAAALCCCRAPQVYRCFESWTPGSDWSVALPEGEEAAVVAAGEDRRLHGGRSLGDALAGHGDHFAESSMVMPAAIVACICGVLLLVYDAAVLHVLLLQAAAWWLLPPAGGCCGCTPTRAASWQCWACRGSPWRQQRQVGRGAAASATTEEHDALAPAGQHDA